MKLPDFKEHVLLNALRKAMDAPYLDMELTGEQIAKWLDKDESETLGFSGMRVLVYTRDIYNGILLKFHISHCGALTKRINENRSWKYAVTTRNDGEFEIRHYKMGRYDETVNEHLEVCGSCLRKLNYKSHNHKPWEQHKIKEMFDIKEFFERYNKARPRWSPLYKYYGYSRHQART